MGLCLYLLLGAGCVAVPFGKTEVFRHELAEVKTGTSPERAKMVRARVELLQRGERAVVSIDADVEEEFAQKRHVRQVTVKRQKRLAFGLFPCAAELVWMPEGALQADTGVWRVTYDLEPRYCGYYADKNPGMGGYVEEQAFSLLLGFGILPALSTCESLFVAPFEPWSCDSHDYIDMEYWRHGVSKNGKTVADASESPRLQALAELPAEMRREIGIRTCFDVRSTGMGGGTHLGLAGFHKYLAVFVDVEECPAEVVESEKRTRKISVEGPCEIELSIPGIGYSRRQIMGRGETSATFELPSAGREMAIEARVAVREAPGAGREELPEWNREAIRKLAGQGSRFAVNLRTGYGAGRGPENHMFEIVGIRRERDGRYEVRVRVDGTLGRETVAEAIAPEVRRRIREDYANRHPSSNAGEVRDRVAWKANPADASMLEFEGWAFSVHPLSAGWHYDEETRRGAIRLAVSGGVPEEQALQWAKENIAAIVADKAIALAEGQSPATGAKFKCLDERYKDGIITVEFEVIE